MTISNRFFVYLQRPDTGAWVTVGRYQHGPNAPQGSFRYAPSYLDAKLPWSIDPVNLPLLPGVTFTAPRYRGLHDALRDAGPDAWGKALLQREHHLPGDAHESVYLIRAHNMDRWGALAFGQSKRPPASSLSHPKLPQLDALTIELLAMFERRPPVDAGLRKRLMATPSIGGARPKATVQDGDDFWLVKPILPSDLADIPLLEHATQRWACASGLNFAATVHHPEAGQPGLSVLRSLRFDRRGARRIMAVSAASLLQTEYPGATAEGVSRWSYPLLATVLKQIGAPQDDLLELFGRMVFNAIVGNDDDHPRNHAVYYDAHAAGWRLAPAFDVVPNVEDRPSRLAMQLSPGRFDISRASILAEALRFGFESRSAASGYLDRLLDAIASGFKEAAAVFSDELLRLMDVRLQENLQLLRESSPSPLMLPRQ